MDLSWYRRAQEEQLDLFEKPESKEEPKKLVEKENNNEEEKGDKPEQTCYLKSAFREGGIYYALLATTDTPRKYYAYWIDPPTKWLDHPRVGWTHWLWTINKKNPNKLWSYVKNMAHRGWEVTEEWPHNQPDSILRELEIRR